MRLHVSIAVLVSLGSVLPGCTMVPPEEDPIYLKQVEIDNRLVRVERIIDNQGLMNLMAQVEELRKEGLRPFGVEGMRGGRWVLIDYVDFVVHVFHPAAREFYQLERLWGDAPVREFTAAS